MTERDAVILRHSVRAYRDEPIESNLIDELIAFIKEINSQSGLNFSLILNEKKAFNGFMAKYGRFSGVSNYIAVMGKKDKTFAERAGYFGEKIVIKAQMLGLNTCWVALTYKKVKSAINIEKNQKLLLVISLGKGKTQGVNRKSKSIKQVCKLEKDTPSWFLNGIDLVLRAPTAMNQQKFFFSQKNGVVSAKAGVGFYTKVDLGIAKYHFEVGAGKENFKWQEELCD